MTTLIVDVAAIVEARWNWLREHNVTIKQDKQELIDALTHVAKNLPEVRSVIELGVLQGGSLYILAGMMAPGAQIIGYDRRGDPSVVTEQLDREGFRVSMHRKSCHYATSIAKARNADRPSIIHIDAMHTAKTVLHNFYEYAMIPYYADRYHCDNTNRFGAVLFHDAASTSTKRQMGVPEAWSLVRQSFPTNCTLFDNDSGMGIGVWV